MTKEDTTGESRRLDETRQESWQLFDPLQDSSPPTSKRVILGMVGIVAVMAIYATLAIGLVFVAPMVAGPEAESDFDEDFSVAMIVEPAPTPEPEPIVEPEPEPEPVLEPEPEPTPRPEPRPEPIEEPEPQPDPDSVPDPVVDEEPASMDPVELEGLTMESTVEGGDFAIKQGVGINTGKMGKKYVDPNRFDKIKTGTGRGDGSGDGTGEGTRRPTPARNCKDIKAKRLPGFYTVPSSQYPTVAKRRGVEAKVVALLTVSASGKVTKVNVIKKGGYGFDELAVEAFKKWKFDPAEQNCERVESKIRYTYDFVLDPY